MTLAVIAAVARNGVIGRTGALPWHLSADLKRFKSLTTGHPIIMGRKTYASIGRPLPNRRSLVVTRDRSFRAEGVEVVHGLEEALEATRHADQRFVIGGAAIFTEALPLATELYLTRVHADVDGDVFFPAFDASEWELVEEERHAADEKNDYAMTFQVYRRRGRFPSRQRPSRETDGRQTS